MIRKYDFKQNALQKEVDTSLQGEYDCSVHIMDMHRALSGHIPAHWHPHMEFSYMQKGESDFNIEQEHFRLYQGEALFINTNMLHSSSVVSEDIPSEIITVKFNPEYLSVTSGSIVDTKYVSPIVQNRSFTYLHVKPDTRDGLRLLSKLTALIDLSEEEPMGYELLLHNCVTELWLELFIATEEQRKKDHRIMTDERIRPMLDYIHENCGEKLTLGEIASVGMVSIRECGRIFQRYVNMPPMNYVVLCRVRKAAVMLTASDRSITEIGEDCGFSSVSYFGKMFEREFGLRPREYRRKNRGDMA